MSTRTYLISCVAVAAVTALGMLLVPPLGQGFEYMVLLFLGTFATS